MGPETARIGGRGAGPEGLGGTPDSYTPQPAHLSSSRCCLSHMSVFQSGLSREPHVSLSRAQGAPGFEEKEAQRERVSPSSLEGMASGLAGLGPGVPGEDTRGCGAGLPSWGPPCQGWGHRR